MIPKALRHQVFDRDGWCVVCGRGLTVDDFEAHHRLRKSQGGKDELANLIALCGTFGSCHVNRVHGNPAEAVVNGWLVPRTGNPADVAVLYADGSLRYLSNLEAAA